MNISVVGGDIVKCSEMRGGLTLGFSDIMWIEITKEVVKRVLMRLCARSYFIRALLHTVDKVCGTGKSAPF